MISQANEIIPRYPLVFCLPVWIYQFIILLLVSLKGLFYPSRLCQEKVHMNMKTLNFLLDGSEFFFLTQSPINYNEQSFVIFNEKE